VARLPAMSYLTYLMTRLGSVRPGRVHRRSTSPLSSRMPRRSDPVEQSDRCRHAVRQTPVPEAIELMRPIAQGRSMDSRAVPRRPVSHLLAPRRGRRFRALAVGVFPDAGPRWLIRGRALPWTVAAAGDLGPLLTWVLGNLLGGLAGLLSAKATRCAWAGILGNGLPSHSPTTSSPSSCSSCSATSGRCWPISGGSTIEHGAGVELGRSPVACSATPSYRLFRWRLVGARRLVHGHALAGLQHRHRGFTSVYARAGAASERRPRPGLLRPCATPWCRRSPASHVARRPSSTAPIITEAGVRLSRHRHASWCSAVYAGGLQPGAGHNHGVDRGRVAGGSC